MALYHNSSAPYVSHSLPSNVFIKERRVLAFNEFVIDCKCLVWIRIIAGRWVWWNHYCNAEDFQKALQALQKSEKTALTCVYHFAITQGKIYDDPLNF